MLADKVTLTNVLGFMTSQAGIVCYAVLKYREDLDEEPSSKATVSLSAHQLHPCPITSGCVRGQRWEDYRGAGQRAPLPPFCRGGGFIQSS